MSYSSCDRASRANVGNYIIDLEDVIGLEYHVGELREYVDPADQRGLGMDFDSNIITTILL